MKNLRILIVDDSLEVCGELRQKLELVTEFDIIKTISEPTAAVSEIRRLKPDILLLDVVMSSLDGDDILESLRGTLDFNMGIIVLSPINNDITISHYSSLGAHYFISKPINTEKLIKKIRLLSENLFRGKETSSPERICSSIGKEAFNRALKSRITRILLKTGINPKLKGFCFIRESVCFICASGNELTSVTKIVYPKIAEEYETESEKVERAIRTAIAKAFSSTEGSKYYYDTLCSCYVREGLKPYPSSREFIFTIAEYINNVEPTDMTG